MLTINSFNIYDYMDLINTTPDGLLVFYRPSANRFEYHYVGEHIDAELIMTPCLYEIKADIWETFYSRLSEAEYSLTQCYPFRKGFVSYLEEIGLRETLREAEADAACNALKTWLMKYNIDISSGYNIDTSFI